jgi:threonine dehydrogenase-like Zn-dependent dehydrogenase
MKAICWEGINKVSTERVPDPTILNPRDAIVKVFYHLYVVRICTCLVAIYQLCDQVTSLDMNSWAKLWKLARK